MKFHPPLVAALLLTTLSAQTERNTELPVFLQQFDTNEDESIDEEERQAIRDLRAQMRKEQRTSIDTDRNGKITAQEVKEARSVLRDQITARRLKKFTTIAGKDALISLAEYATIPGIDSLPAFVLEAIFARLDADDSGDISSAEFFSRLRKHR